MLIWSQSTILFFLFILLNICAEFGLRPFELCHKQREKGDDFAFMPLSFMPQKLMLNLNTPYISLILTNCLVMTGHGLSGENRIELIQEV